MAYSLPASAASPAVAAGAPMRAVYALYHVMILAAMQRVAEVSELGDDETGCDLDAFNALDWRALAERAGERLDIPAWDRHLRATFNKDEAPASHSAADV